MARPEDAALLSALEAQLRELSYLLGGLETAQVTLVPPPADFWRGAAGTMYEAERSALASAIGQATTTIDEARLSTALAVQQVMSRV